MFDPLRSKLRVLLYTSAIFLLGIGSASLLGWTGTSFAAPIFREVPPVSEEEVRPAVDLSNSFIAISEAVTPAVVRIEVERSRTVASSPADPLRWFFEGPGERGREQPEQREQLQTSGGSGFIVSPNGYILTNDHVVSGASQIRVHLPDRREYLATLVGTDPTTDVAVIRIDERNLPTMSLGSSGDVRVGEWVLAVGNPGFGSGSSLDYTVTAGIVSAIGRPLALIQGELQRQEEWREVARFAIEDFIQTDAVINPGNSGGPLVNMRGQVVGINSAIASRTGFYQGYGFAIPVDLAKRIMEDLIEYGEVRRAFLGISMNEITPVDAEYYGLPRTTGVLVQDAEAGGPAASAGLRQEDVVVAVDGQAVERPGQLQTIIAQKRPGDRVAVRYYRDGRAQEVTVRLGQAPIQPRAAQPVAETTRTEERLGLQVGPLDDQVARRFGYEEAGGVVVRGVSPGGAATRAGIVAGEKVLEINRQPVNAVEDVNRALMEVSAGDVVNLRLGDPNGTTRVVNVRLPR